MPKFDANITFLFREQPLVERFDAAKKAGFDGVEILMPEGVEIPDLAAAAKQAGVEVVLCNAPMGDFLEGGPGMSAVPGRQEEFREALTLARAMGQALGCSRIHIGPSRVAEGDNRDQYLDQLVENLRMASELLGEADIDVLVEPLNTTDMPGVLLSRVGETLAVIDRAGCDNVRLQYDIYHLYQTEEDSLGLLEKHVYRIGHVQMADFPGRSEPGTGEINFKPYFEILDQAGYTGWVGAEYMPKRGTHETLGWMKQYS